LNLERLWPGQIVLTWPSTSTTVSGDSVQDLQKQSCDLVARTRECLAIDVAGSIRSGRVIEVLSQLVSVHGAPRYLRSDNGPEFVSRAILKWAAHNGMDMPLSDPGKPWQNGEDESFNGKFRDECLSLEAIEAVLQD
jgi:transposase InsO family protein